ncbi:alpha/beta hydrolase [Streptomyces erythrochromogenes]|uniref:alpha/beta fold hydrolase n=1 Tax=Streptomyces erythrochromogenes TaxID=285574 RepID=UPI00341EF330
MTAASASAPTSFLDRPDGARLALHVTGVADPDLVVVLAHGWQAAASVWDRHARRLHLPAVRIRVIRFDQRGHGASTSGSLTAQIGVLADDLAAIVSAGAPRGVPVLLAGHSMGAMSVLGLAARHPHLIGAPVTGVLLASATLGGLDLSGADHPLRRRVVARTRRTMAAACLRVPGPAQVVRNVVRPRPYTQPSIEVAAAWFHALMEHDVVGQVGVLARVPVHVLVGELDPLTGPLHALRLVQEIPGARLHLVAGGGHRLPTRSPAEVEAVLRLASQEAVSHRPTMSLRAGLQGVRLGRWSDRLLRTQPTSRRRR